MAPRPERNITRTNGRGRSTRQANDQGIEFLTHAEADQIAASDGDYHQRDLYEAIKRGEHPSWTLKMQIMPFEEVRNYRFNPFDLTKVWPHGDYPLIEVGKLILDRNLTDYHTEMEQAAFEPNNLVPGVTQGRPAGRQRSLQARRLARRRRHGAPPTACTPTAQESCTAT